jgi:ATP-dependent Clp protease ATP-binding subunit ClpA
MSAKYINERFLPDKAIDLIDEAGAYRRLHPTERKTQTVDKNVINEVLTTVCRVPAETVSADDISGLAGLEKRLKKNIFGQDEAIDQVVNAVKFSKAGLLEENKPLASLLFVGPTGVGKTEIARKLAEELGVKLIRFDMSEYGEKHAVAKLIGAPAGYVGYEDGGLLTEAVRKSPSAVLLLDEIEKAHADIYNILLQVMDYATLTDNQGRKADFRNIIVIMTSNAGADRIGKTTIGFQSASLNASVIMESVKQTFQPEFRNRLNKIVVFNSMDDRMAELIVGKKLDELARQLSAKKIEFTADKRARALVQQKGISQEFGAREVDRVIRNEIKPLFVDEMLFGKLKNGGKLTLSASDGDFVITAGKKGRA